MLHCLRTWYTLVAATPAGVKAAAAFGQHRKLFSNSSSPSPSPNITSPSPSPPPESLKTKIEEEARHIEHNKAETAVAAVLGALLLGSMFGCVGYLLYRRFVVAKAGHVAAQRRTDRAAYYNADREFGDGADL